MRIVSHVYHCYQGITERSLVAGLAVISSFVGPYYVARFSVRSEHKVWQRGLRVQIYSALADAADQYERTLRRAPPPYTQERMAAFDALGAKVTDVETFGSLKVGKAALGILKETGISIYSKDIDKARSDVNTAISEFRKAVRDSLQIAD
ncbi:MAG TPA: hypothetical protein VNF05_09570 [Acidimicrobiales bacterium]|nr:hypothetical protein [Acidimicrobiales bacterium]